MILSVKLLRALKIVVARLTLCRWYAVPPLSVLLSGVSIAAHATCIVASPAAQLCQSGAAAAVAFLRTRPHDGSVVSSGVTMDSDATDMLLARSGCIRTGSNAPKLDVREISTGPVTLSEGTVKVAFVVVNGESYWYVAEGFLKGACDRPLVPAQTAPAAIR